MTPISMARAARGWLFVAALALVLPATTSAQGFLSGSVGVNFGGDTLEETLLPFGGKPLTWNVAVGSLSGVGFELEYGHTSDFFKSESLIASKVSITTLTGSVLIAPGSRRAAIRPYAAGGVGLIRANVSAPFDLFDALSRNDFGVNAGGGLFVFLTDGIGMRGDVRYFRTLGSDSDSTLGLVLGDFDFWRGTVGLSFRW
ncbi:MAG: outer membrane beta-barrel protein [Acidobacteria bacterium]|nr:outer membrane beta-barrel protein [Acidobacteriota bacterium]